MSKLKLLRRKSNHLCCN